MALLGAYVLVILMTSLIPMDREIKGLNFIIGIKPIIQNSLHVPVFALLAVLSLQILSIYQINGWKRLLLVLLFAVGFGLLNEFMQLAVPGRYPSVIDMGLNTVGVFVGAFIYFFIERNGSGLIKRLVCQ